MKEERKVVILGAGPAGLSTAYCLSHRGYQVLIIERANYIGGASASFKIKDYIVDYGPHAFHIKKEEIVRMVTDLLGEDYNRVKRKSRLILNGKNLAYPLNIKEAFAKIDLYLSFKVVSDYLNARFKKLLFYDKEVKTFQDWGVDAFGNTLYRLAFGDYSERVWGMSGDRLSSKLAQQKLLKLDLLKIIRKMLYLADTTFEGGITDYYDLYPRFGIGTVFNKMQEKILKDSSNEIFLNTKIINLKGEKNSLKTIDFEYQGEKLTKKFDYLISTIPLKYLCEYISTPQKNPMLESIAKELKYRAVRIIYVVLDKDYFSDTHWIYLLDRYFKFNRLSEQKNLNKESSPSGKTVISLDIACDYGDEIWDMSEINFFQLALNDLIHFGIEESHIKDYFSLKLQDVYPVYDLDFDTRFYNILDILQQYSNLYSVGRQGLFLNNDIHDSLQMGKFCGEFIAGGKNSRDWYEFIGAFIRNVLEGKRN